MLSPGDRGRERGPLTGLFSPALIIAMTDDPNNGPPDVEPPSPARVHRNYVLKCRRLGITSNPLDCSTAPLTEWTALRGRPDSTPQ